MLPVSSTLRTQLEAYLRTQGSPNTEQAAYAKWLCYYLDFFAPNIIFLKNTEPELFINPKYPRKTGYLRVSKEKPGFETSYSVSACLSMRYPLSPEIYE